jgi:mRNA-degrading endonuclease RelE of RelBE toxin-antitoxin system
MVWDVKLTTKAQKNCLVLPKGINEIFQALLADLKLSGPARWNWANYGKLRKDCYHCHLQKGNPTYVAVWRVISKAEKIIEVTYVGTHEKAYYGRLC